MKIIISGYGRMGKEIEKAALEEGHQIVAKVDRLDDWKGIKERITRADVVIDFSMPGVVVENIERCFDMGIPIVSGTTGWYDQLSEVSELCKQKEGTLFYAPNFSIGVNLFFLINKKLAKTMSSFGEYRVSMKEIHHIHKLDAPSGTAIKAAEDIIAEHEFIGKWSKSNEAGKGELPIEAERTDEIPGTHIVTYSSDTDLIELKHEAKNRSGFAKGAVKAAKWVMGKKGVFTMDNFLHSII
jgi:4-hydroxy-tetrahydrodipicolinate reductase